jgi:hypothetical protein
MRIRVRPRWILAAGTLILFVLAVLVEPTGIIRGWLCGEAFYQGRPATFWSAELARWQCCGIWWEFSGRAAPRGMWGMALVDTAGEVAGEVPIQGQLPQNGLVFAAGLLSESETYSRTPSRFEQWLDRVGLAPEHGERPALLSGDPDAEAVLRELLDDPDETVREHARRGLKQIERKRSPW